MRKLIMFLSLALAFVLSVVTPSKVEAQTAISTQWLDSLSAAGAVDTVVRAVADLGYSFNYEAWIEADSISGSTDGTAYLQYSPIGTKAGSSFAGQTHWQTIETVTINGVLTQSGKKTGHFFGGGRLRWLVICPSSTQVTQIWTNIGRSRKLE